MARVRRSAASLLTVVTLAGSPALWSACVALCLPGMSGHAMATVAAPAEGCPEHDSATPPAAAAAVTASGTACCVDGLTAAAPAVAAERADTRAGAAGGLTPAVAWTSAPLLRAGVRVAHDRGSPPPPLRRPAVLRI